MEDSASDASRSGLRSFRAATANEGDLRDAASHRLLTGVERGCVVDGPSGRYYICAAPSLLCTFGELLRQARGDEALLLCLVERCRRFAEALVVHGLYPTSLPLADKVYVHASGRLCAPSLFFDGGLQRLDALPDEELREARRRLLRALALELLERWSLPSASAKLSAHAAELSEDLDFPRARAMHLRHAPQLSLGELQSSEMYLMGEEDYTDSTHLLDQWLEDCADPQGRARAVDSSRAYRVVFELGKSAAQAADAVGAADAYTAEALQASELLQALEALGGYARRPLGFATAGGGRFSLCSFGAQPEEESPSLLWWMISSGVTDEELRGVALGFVELLVVSASTRRVFVLALSPINVEARDARRLRFINVGFEGRARKESGKDASARERAGALRCCLVVAMLYLREVWLLADARAATRHEVAAWARLRARAEVVMGVLRTALERNSRYTVPPWRSLAASVRLAFLDLFGSDEEFASVGVLCERVKRAAKRQHWDGRVKESEGERRREAASGQSGGGASGQSGPSGGGASGQSGQSGPSGPSGQSGQSGQSAAWDGRITRFLAAPGAHIPRAGDLGEVAERLLQRRGTLEAGGGEWPALTGSALDDLLEETQREHTAGETERMIGRARRRAEREEHVGEEEEPDDEASPASSSGSSSS